MTVKIAIQGEQGSACEMAAPRLLAKYGKRFDLVYFQTAQGAVEALQSFVAEYAVFALESPVGIAVAETTDALIAIPGFQVVECCCLPVNHVILTKLPLQPLQVKKVLSHPVPLAKHSAYIHLHYPNASLESVEDTGTAARKLAEGYYGDAVAVIALPSTAQLFGLIIISSVLPGNRNYKTKFILVRPSTKEEYNTKAQILS